MDVCLDPPEGKTESDVPVGFKIAGGEGTEENPYVFELVYEKAAADLWIGSQGEDVSTLQTMLADLGYYFGTIDGEFGFVTDAAVRAFQAVNGLYADGIIGAQTKAFLGLQ